MDIAIFLLLCYYFGGNTATTTKAATTTTATTTATTTGTGEIHGIKFEDWDDDKSPYEGQWEIKLGGWTIYLDSNDNSVLDLGEISTTTNAPGAYSFLALPAGTYHVREVQKPGWKQTVHPGAIQIYSNKQAIRKHFGNTQKVRLGRDKNRNDEYLGFCPQG